MYITHVLMVPGVTFDCVPGVTNLASLTLGHLTPNNKPN